MLYSRCRSSIPHLYMGYRLCYYIEILLLIVYFDRSKNTRNFAWRLFSVMLLHYCIRHIHMETWGHFPLIGCDITMMHLLGISFILGIILYIEVSLHTLELIHIIISLLVDDSHEYVSSFSVANIHDNCFLPHFWSSIAQLLFSPAPIFRAHAQYRRRFNNRATSRQAHLTIRGAIAPYCRVWNAGTHRHCRCLCRTHFSSALVNTDHYHNFRQLAVKITTTLSAFRISSGFHISHGIFIRLKSHHIGRQPPHRLFYGIREDGQSLP